jgi:hypothetical protein
MKEVVYALNDVVVLAEKAQLCTHHDGTLTNNVGIPGNVVVPRLDNVVLLATNDLRPMNRVVCLEKHDVMLETDDLSLENQVVRLDSRVLSLAAAVGLRECFYP